MHPPSHPIQQCACGLPGAYSTRTKRKGIQRRVDRSKGSRPRRRDPSMADRTNEFRALIATLPKPPPGMAPVCTGRSLDGLSDVDTHGHTHAHDGSQPPYTHAANQTATPATPRQRCGRRSCSSTTRRQREPRREQELAGGGNSAVPENLPRERRGDLPQNLRDEPAAEPHEPTCDCVALHA